VFELLLRCVAVALLLWFVVAPFFGGDEYHAGRTGMVIDALACPDDGEQKTKVIR